jgi:carbamate kinase
LLADLGVIVICGGGIPVVRTPEGAQYGCEAVIDEDRFSALLADRLEAEFLLLLTDVATVFQDWPEPACRPIRRAIGRRELRVGRAPQDSEAMRGARAAGLGVPSVEGCSYPRSRTQEGVLGQATQQAYRRQQRESRERGVSR